MLLFFLCFYIVAIFDPEAKQNHEHGLLGVLLYYFGLTMPFSKMLRQKMGVPTRWHGTLKMFGFLSIIKMTPENYRFVYGRIRFIARGSTIIFEFTQLPSQNPSP
jgi:hypothetical protein